LGLVGSKTRMYIMVTFIILVLLGVVVGYIACLIFGDDDKDTLVFFIICGCILVPLAYYNTPWIRDYFEGENDKQAIEQSNTLAYPPSTGQNEPTKRIVPQNQQTRSPQKTKSVTVRAEVFHLINNYDGTHTIKDANRKKSITIDVYDDGNMYLSEGFLSAVRYSNLHGYEYECNMGNDIYAFNYDDLTGN